MAPGSRRFYVAPRGSDRAPGTAARPFASLQRARDAVRSLGRNRRDDLTVFLRGGRHQLAEPLRLEPRDSGRNGSNVVYRACPGEAPVLSGGRRIRGWTLHDRRRNVWRATVGRISTRQLYVNGRRAVRARGSAPGQLVRRPGGYQASTEQMTTWRRPSDLEFVFRLGAPAWTEPRCPVATVRGNRVRMAEPCWSNTTQRAGSPQLSADATPAWIENAYELLDEPGEWYLDRPRGVLYYIPRPGEALARAAVVAPVLETLVEGRGSPARPIQNIRFRGITFADATWLLPSTREGFSELQANFIHTGRGAGRRQGLCETITPPGACPYGAWTKAPAAVRFSAARRISFERNRFTRLGSAGLGFESGSQGNLVIGNEFTDISGSGITIGDVHEPSQSDRRRITRDNRLLNNYVHRIGSEYHGAVGIWQGYVQRSLIAHNQISDIPYTGISTGWGWGKDRSVMVNVSRGNRITANRIFRHLQELLDGGGVYSLGRQGPSLREGLVVDRNVVHGQRSYRALFTDEGTRYATLAENVLYRNANDIGGCRPYGDLVFRRNYWQVPKPDWACAEPRRVVFDRNAVIESERDAPASIRDAAGLEPPYRYLLRRPSRR